MMDKLKMHTPNGADENYKKLKELFPNAVTETVNEYGEAVRAIDADVLRQEISAAVVEGPQERYQFTWPDKKKSVVLANQPIAKTLRLDREKSVGRDGTPGGIDTENIYIEGDNLDALKLLQETYLGKVKMIYIDPPYNTGGDFIYEDDFRTESLEFRAKSGDFDDEGNRLVKNLDSNGRFHTDWLNMMYPRLRIAKDLLTDDGAIFMSIDDNEQENLKKICNEIFGTENYVATFPWRKRTAKSDVPFGISQDYEWIICYAKSQNFMASVEGKERKYYETEDFLGRPWRFHDLTKQTSASERPNSFFTIINPKTGEKYSANPNRTWAITEETFRHYYAIDRIIFPGDYSFLNIQKPVLRYWKEDDMEKAGDKFGRVAVTTKLADDIGMSQDGTKEITNLLKSKVFSFPKPSSLIKFLVNIHVDTDDVILDFFSGSATTAHAVMQLNAEDGGHRKFIMVQLPEACDEKSEAFKAGYRNICEIGEERIRRAGKQILELSKESLELSKESLELSKEGLECIFEGLVKEGVIEKYAGELSEVRSLEEVYGSCGASLSLDEEIAEGGDVCSVGSAASGGCINSVEHSRRSSPRNQGIHSFFESGKGFKSRNGNTIVDMRTLGLLNENGYRICNELVGGNQQNDIFADEKSYDENLELKLLSLSSKLQAPSSVPDVGFRVFRVDSSNMREVYYTPAQYDQGQIEMFADNIKEGRTPEDLLFQVMLDLGILLSSDIEETEIAGKRVFSVAGGYLIACFEAEVTEETVTEIAKRHPFYAVFRDSGIADDSVMTNFEQIFETYSPNTQRRVL